MTNTKPIRQEMMWIRDAEAASPALTDAGRRLARTLTRLIVEDGPVEAGRLADSLGLTREAVEEMLGTSPWIYRDGRGQVVGFWGLSAVETPHQLIFGDRHVYAWCAHDTLFLGIVLDILFDRPVHVESTCPVTGKPIRLDVSPSGVRNIRPEGAVMSFLRPSHPEASLSGDVITNVCHYVQFFASSDAARTWTAAHEGTFPITIEQAWPFAQETALHEWLGLSIETSHDQARAGAG